MIAFSKAGSLQVPQLTQSALGSLAKGIDVAFDSVGVATSEWHAEAPLKNADAAVGAAVDEASAVATRLAQHSVFAAAPPADREFWLTIGCVALLRAVFQRRDA